MSMPKSDQPDGDPVTDRIVEGLLQQPLGRMVCFEGGWECRVNRPDGSRLR